MFDLSHPFAGLDLLELILGLIRLGLVSFGLMFGPSHPSVKPDLLELILGLIGSGLGLFGLTFGLIRSSHLFAGIDLIGLLG